MTEKIVPVTSTNVRNTISCLLKEGVTRVITCQSEGEKKISYRKILKKFREGNVEVNSHHCPVHDQGTDDVSSDPFALRHRPLG